VAEVVDDTEVGHIEAGEGIVPQASGLWRPWTVAIDRVIGAVVEPVVAVLIVAEVAILASGVFSRYVLHNAIVWTDEMATILFLWLAMLGAVIAYRRGEHMRLTALYRRRPMRQKQIFDAITAVVVCAFALELMPSSYAFILQEQIDLTPALNIPRSYVVSAITVALVLMLIIAVMRLIDSDLKVSGAVVGVAIAISVVAVLLKPQFATLGNFNLVLFFVILVGAFIAIGVPIAFTFGFATLSYLAPDPTGGAPTSTAAGLIDSVLALGSKSGYSFTYSPGTSDSTGRINTYAFTAVPITSSTGTNYYYTDQSGVIRQNSTTTAGSTDSPIAG